MSGYIEADTYLQLRRTEGVWNRPLRVIKSTQRKPAVLEPGCVVVKVRIRVPAAAFEPLTPEAVVTVPESLIQHTVQATAEEMP
ncbi:hypothetical protein [Arthrobacter sp. B2a2-09]|uniref:hypothetical protein n=1 Tax=Arthrobacter sp. B2a2-09 TaxID=2952822 RepID=UPI0022CD835E|nr:hypothetical protein [Arthrobacter sp. B2a2-09]MCZ9884113.1 hypothetical protein [Arthrobacter sp. B2a2-09]